jgi:hypothetical protein
MNPLEAIVSIASDLTAALSSEERYERLLGALHRIIPFDASSLLRLEGDEDIGTVVYGIWFSSSGGSEILWIQNP